MTAVVIYFSRAGENYLNGTKQRITKRNTAILAEKISHALAIESYELLPDYCDFFSGSRVEE